MVYVMMVIDGVVVDGVYDVFDVVVVGGVVDGVVVVGGVIDGGGD